MHAKHPTEVQSLRAKAARDGREDIIADVVFLSGLPRGALWELMIPNWAHGAQFMGTFSAQFGNSPLPRLEILGGEPNSQYLGTHWELNWAGFSPIIGVPLLNWAPIMKLGTIGH